MLETVVLFFAWVSQVAYTLCFLPQIVTNYRVKSGSGMSELFLIAYLNLHAVTLFYVFLLNLPFAYKMCVPLQVSLILVMIIQRIWYDREQLAKRLSLVYLSNLAILVAFIPYAIDHPMLIGHVGGWGNVVLGLLSQVPQAFKIWRERSVAGFDKSFVYILLFAGLFEFCGAVIGGLPLQTRISSFRVMLFGALFLWQFKLFAHAHARQN